MTRLFRNEPVQVRRDPRTHEPLTLKWHERVHKVQRVVSSYRVETDWWTEEGEVARDVNKLTTRDGPCHSPHQWWGLHVLDVIFDRIEQQWYALKLYD